MEVIAIGLEAITLRLEAIASSWRPSQFSPYRTKDRTQTEISLSYSSIISATQTFPPNMHLQDLHLLNIVSQSSRSQAPILNLHARDRFLQSFDVATSTNQKKTKPAIAVPQ